VVHPQPAHRVVDGRVDAHRDLVRVLARDALVHLEQVAVLLLHSLPAEPVDGVAEVEVDAQAAGSDAAALVADVLGGAGGDVTRDQVAEGGVDPLQVVVALVVRDVAGRAGVVLAQRHPDAAVVAQRLGHERELRLVVAGDRDAGGVDLRVAGVGEVGAALVGAPDGGGVAALGVRGQVEHVAVAAGGEDHGVGEVPLDLAGHHVADDDAARPPVGDDQVEHLVAGVHLHVPGRDLPLQGLVRAEQELLARLAAGVEGTGDLGAAEGPGVEQAAVLPGERHALFRSLVDDVHRDLGQPVDVRLAGAEVAALHRVVEQAVDGVAVAAVVLGGVDAALGGDGVGAPGRVLVAERLDVVAELAERRGGRAAGQAGADDDDGELALVCRVHQAGAELALLPPLLDGTGVGLGVADLRAFDVIHWTTPNVMASGGARKPTTRTAATSPASPFSALFRLRLATPRVWKALQMPCRRCRPTMITATMYRSVTYHRDGSKPAIIRSAGVEAKPSGFTTPKVRSSRCQTRKSAIVMPPNRMMCVAYPLARDFFF